MSLVTTSNSFSYLSNTKMSIMSTSGVSKNLYYVNKTSRKVAYPKESKMVIDWVVESIQCNVCKIGIDVETANNNMSEIERTTAKPAKTNCIFKHHTTSAQCGVIDLSIEEAIL